MKDALALQAPTKKSNDPLEIKSLSGLTIATLGAGPLEAPMTAPPKMSWFPEGRVEDDDRTSCRLTHAEEA